MTVLICLAVAVLAAGIMILMSPSSPSGGGHQVTIKNDGSVITVRSAGAGNICVTFDPSDIPSEQEPLELQPGGDMAAEGELTLLEEFLSRQTETSRKREIMRYLSDLGYRFSLREEEPETHRTDSGGGWLSATEPALGQDVPPGEPIDLGIEDVGEGCDEGLERPE